MAEILKTQFPPPQPRLIPTFDFLEFISGEGHVAFYLMDTSGAVLTSNSTMNGSGGIQALSFTDKQFSATFNRPVIVDGQCIINLASFLKNDFGSAQNMDNTFSGAIMKDSGGTITNLSQTGLNAHAVTSLATGATDHDIMAWHLDLPVTKFKIGDKLIISVTGTANNQQGSAVHDLGTSPAKEDVWGTGDNSQSQILIPFRADITA